MGGVHIFARCGSHPDNKYAYELPPVVQRLGEKWARIAEVAGGSITAQEQLWKRITAAEFAGNDKDVWIERIGHGIPADNIPHEYVYTAKELRDFGLITGKPAEELPDAKRFIEILTGEKAEYCRELGNMRKEELEKLLPKIKVKRGYKDIPLQKLERKHLVLTSPDFFVGKRTKEIKTLKRFYEEYGEEEQTEKYARRVAGVIRDGRHQAAEIVINARNGEINRKVAKDALSQAIKASDNITSVFFLGKDSAGYYNFIWD